MTTIKAAIDIGTNTAHIIIARVSNVTIEKVLYRKRFYIYLAEEGILKIGDAAKNRLYGALDHFNSKIDEYQCDTVHIVATEAMRKASNGPEIRQHVHKILGWAPEIISGEAEATYIYQGVSNIKDLSSGHHLIVDIGGGSVEFIYTEQGTIKDLKSLPIGIANLYNHYHSNEPLTSVDLTNLAQHLSGHLEFLKDLNPHVELIGSAGTFEIFTQSANTQVIPDIVKIKVSEVKALLSALIKLNLSEREQMKAIPVERAKYIVVALFLIDFICDSLELDSFWVSRYALKEGVLLSK